MFGIEYYTNHSKLYDISFVLDCNTERTMNCLCVC